MAFTMPPDPEMALVRKLVDFRLLLGLEMQPKMEGQLTDKGLGAKKSVYEEWISQAPIEHRERVENYLKGLNELLKGDKTAYKLAMQKLITANLRTGEFSPLVERKIEAPPVIVETETGPKTLDSARGTHTISERTQWISLFLKHVPEVSDYIASHLDVLHPAQENLREYIEKNRKIIMPKIREETKKTEEETQMQKELWEKEVVKLRAKEAGKREEKNLRDSKAANAEFDLVVDQINENIKLVKQVYNILRGLPRELNPMTFSEDMKKETKKKIKSILLQMTSLIKGEAYILSKRLDYPEEEKLKWENKAHDWLVEEETIADKFQNALEQRLDGLSEPEQKMERERISRMSPKEQEAEERKARDRLRTCRILVREVLEDIKTEAKKKAEVEMKAKAALLPSKSKAASAPVKAVLKEGADFCVVLPGLVEKKVFTFPDKKSLSDIKSSVGDIHIKIEPGRTKAEIEAGLRLLQERQKELLVDETTPKKILLDFSATAIAKGTIGMIVEDARKILGAELEVREPVSKPGVKGPTP